MLIHCDRLGLCRQFAIASRGIRYGRVTQGCLTPTRAPARKTQLPQLATVQSVRWQIWDQAPQLLQPHLRIRCTAPLTSCLVDLLARVLTGGAFAFFRCTELCPFHCCARVAARHFLEQRWSCAWFGRGSRALASTRRRWPAVGKDLARSGAQARRDFPPLSFQAAVTLGELQFQNSLVPPFYRRAAALSFTRVPLARKTRLLWPCASLATVALVWRRSSVARALPSLAIRAVRISKAFVASRVEGHASTCSHSCGSTSATVVTSGDGAGIAISSSSVAGVGGKDGISSSVGNIAWKTPKAASADA